MLRRNLTIFSLSFILTSCLSNALSDGSDTIIKESSNARHDKKAILFSREAGATVPDSYQVSVMNYNKKFDTTEVGNAFTFDSNHGLTRLDSASANFTWIADDSLQIDYDKNLRTFIKETKVHGVNILYKER